jgi:hypothetical protein
MPFVVPANARSPAGRRQRGRVIREASGAERRQDVPLLENRFLVHSTPVERSRAYDRSVETFTKQTR